MTTLAPFEEIELPLSWVTLATVVYGARGAGKTTWASVVCEECAAAGQRFVVVDPKGDYWGLKARADGDHAGLPVVIFGGGHADLPLTETTGAAIARMVVGMDASVVLDLERLRKGAQVRFLAAFFETLYDLNRDSLLVVLDEAQRYAPQNARDAQRTEGYATRCLGAIEDVVKLGRKHGLGIVLVTQRGAGLNKECSELCDMLVAFRTPGTLDQAREKEWLGANAGKEHADAAMAVVPGLETGEAVVASAHPSLRLFEVSARTRTRWTFDSCATPQPGVTRTVPATLAEVDVAALAAMLDEAVEEVAADDPAALRERVKDLERQLHEALGRKAERVEVLVPVLDAALVERLEAVLSGIANEASGMASAADELFVALKEGPRIDGGQDVLGGGPAGGDADPGAVDEGQRTPQRADPPRGWNAGGPSVPRSTPAADGQLTAVRKADVPTLTTLAWADSVGLAPLDRDTLAVLAGSSPNSGAYSQKLARLRDEGLVEYPSPGTVAATRTYLAAVPAPPGPASSEDLQAAILARLPGALRPILAELVRRRGGIGRDELAAVLGRSTTSGAFSQSLAALVRLGVAHYPAPGRIAPAPVLWLPDDRRG